MHTICSAHETTPAIMEVALDDEALDCYGELWICQGCGDAVCYGYGASDDMPEHCDACWAKAHADD